MTPKHVYRLAAGLVALLLAAAPARGQIEIDCDGAERIHAGARGVAFLVISEGAVVCERYRRGAERGDAHDIASITKSLAAVMAAAAVQDGLFTLDTPVADILPSWRNDPDRAGVTVRLLLHQASGLNAEYRRLPSYQAAASGRMDRAPGDRFVYGAGHYEAFGAVLLAGLTEAELDPTPAHYLARRILGPIGAATSGWTAIDGQPTLSEGARMTPLDLGRFGILAVRGGEIGGVRLADPEAMEALFTAGPVNPAYGLGWWLIDPAVDQRWPVWLDADIETPGFPRVIMAAGAGGQRLYLVPELDLVVVRMTRGVIEDPASYAEDWSDRRFLQSLIRMDEG